VYVKEKPAAILDGNRLMLLVVSLDYLTSATAASTSATTVSTALLSVAALSTTAATSSTAATTVSQHALSQALSALSALPQENMVALKATASKRTNFFIFFLIKSKTILLCFKNDAKLWQFFISAKLFHTFFCYKA